MATTTLPFPTTSATHAAVSAPTGSRFAFLDGLRGLAALAVCCYHIERYAPFQESVAAITPEPVTWAIRHGWSGVQVFFVISGFVIAYSLRNAIVTPRYVSEFLCRRTIRLTPPYVILVLVGLVLGFAPELVGLPSSCDQPVTWGQAISHLFYLQNICGYENLSAGFWTLCIEMQFYALFVILVGIAQILRLSGRMTEEQSAWSLALVCVPLGLASLFWWNIDTNLDVWVIHFWGLFVAGALAWWVLDRRLPVWVPCLYLGAMAVRLWFEWTNELFAATAAGTVVLVAVQFGGLNRWLSASWLQYLGRVSYSLYLVHYPIGHLVLNIGKRLTGDAAVPGLMWMLLSIGLSLVVAEAFYRVIEAPCVRWSGHFKRGAPQSVAATQLQPA